MSTDSRPPAGSTAEKNLAELAAALEEDLEQFTEGSPPSDDRTLLLAHRLPS